MPAPERYASPLAFKSALEARIRNQSQGAIQRFRPVLGAGEGTWDPAAWTWVP
ncbi:MAG: hypothetical protein AB7N76_10515 [Planctomycetota bacterium]